MTHPEYAALVRVICAEPDEDTPRLVAADWLDEHGDADRAAFIRLQVELARLEAAGLRDGAEAEALRRRERAYLGPTSHHWRVWAAEECPELVRVTFWDDPARATNPLASMHVEGADRLRFSRGFIDDVECLAADWLQHGGAIRQRQPIRVVRLTDWFGLSRDRWWALFPRLRGLRWLALMDRGIAPGIRELLDWLREQLPGVRVGAFDTTAGDIVARRRDGEWMDTRRNPD